MSGKHGPSENTIALFAQALRVPKRLLRGEKAPDHQIGEVPPAYGREDERDLLDHYNALSGTARRVLLNVARALSGLDRADRSAERVRTR
ncbi:MAG: hypothetical protein ACRES7_06240 [Gammaproteobacteria bacterium]